MGSAGGGYINKKFFSLIDFFIIMHKPRFRYMVSSANKKRHCGQNGKVSGYNILFKVVIN